MVAQVKSVSRRRRLEQRLDIGRSTIYAQVADELLPPPIPIGKRAKAWIDNEIDQVIAARVSGASNDEIRVLVRRLVEARIQEAGV